MSRNMSNLTPAQLEQFESTFRYFDRDESNTLDLDEMAAALASLGIVYSVSCSDWKRIRLMYNCAGRRLGRDIHAVAGGLWRGDVRGIYQFAGTRIDRLKHDVVTQSLQFRSTLWKIRRRRSSCVMHSAALRTTRCVAVSDSGPDSPRRLQTFVSELDLRVALLPAGAIEYLRQVMPPASDGGYDYEAWLDQVFA